MALLDSHDYGFEAFNHSLVGRVEMPMRDYRWRMFVPGLLWAGAAW